MSSDRQITTLAKSSTIYSIAKFYMTAIVTTSRCCHCPPVSQEQNGAQRALPLSQILTATPSRNCRSKDIKGNQKSMTPWWRVLPRYTVTWANGLENACLLTKKSNRAWPKRSMQSVHTQFNKAAVQGYAAIVLRPGKNCFQEEEFRNSTYEKLDTFFPT